MGLVRRERNWCWGAGARNIGLRAARLLTNYLIPILFPTDVLLNLNRMLVTIYVTLPFKNSVCTPWTSGGQLWRSNGSGSLSLNQRRGVRRYEDVLELSLSLIFPSVLLYIFSGLRFWEARGHHPHWMGPGNHSCHLDSC